MVRSLFFSLLYSLPIFISINLGGTGEGPGMTGFLVFGFSDEKPKPGIHVQKDFIHIYSFEL